ncbi:hypothetical protein T492DRAFT_1078675 [Pavlovales sp. CCMP2436]|nr:hypothetical protein T492DRAFT_1078675 [Pavlovales sp. CCMP2436]
MPILEALPPTARRPASRDASPGWRVGRARARPRPRCCRPLLSSRPAPSNPRAPTSTDLVRSATPRPPRVPLARARTRRPCNSVNRAMNEAPLRARLPTSSTRAQRLFSKLPLRHRPHELRSARASQACTPQRSVTLPSVCARAAVVASAERV